MRNCKLSSHEVYSTAREMASKVENPSVSKKPRLPLSLKRNSSSKKPTSSLRFALASDADAEKAAKGVVPDNTVHSNAWAWRNVEEWARIRNAANPSDAVPEELLSLNDPDVVCKWLCKFVLETRQGSGKPYPPKSLYSILCGLQHVNHSNGVRFNFLDKEDLRFTELHKTLDTVFSDLHSQGIGASTTSAPVVSVKDEDVLLDEKVMSMDDPASLQNMTFFYVCLHCSLWGVLEQQILSFEQFTRYPSHVSQYDQNTYYEYTEFISKNNQYRFNDVHSKNKTVKVYAMVGSKNCIVRILDFYLKKLPLEPKALYLRPLPKAPAQMFQLVLTLGIKWWQECQKRPTFLPNIPTIPWGPFLPLVSSLATFQRS